LAVLHRLDDVEEVRGRGVDILPERERLVLDQHAVLGVGNQFGDHFRIVVRSEQRLDPNFAFQDLGLERLERAGARRFGDHVDRHQHLGHRRLRRLLFGGRAVVLEILFEVIAEGRGEAAMGHDGVPLRL
jgi:hypothetical protein